MPGKLLVLAGTYFQIPVINYAKSQGYSVITCDNRPDNPGHKIADEYVNVSTTDIKGILKVAKDRKIDGILAYGTDPAAITAAYVAEKLKLPGNSYDSVLTLSDKGLFREFLRRNGFPVPDFKVFKSPGRAISYFNSQNKCCYVKPVDSSGSKGVTRLAGGDDFIQAFQNAMVFSRKGEIIIEEEIKPDGPHIHGEAFVYNGEIVLMLLGDQYFSRVSICAPMSTNVPSQQHSDVMKKAKGQLSEIIRLTGFNTGGLNIEIIRDEKDNLYFIEIGARNGGNFMPELVSSATGFNLASANVCGVFGIEPDRGFTGQGNQIYTQLIVHSHKNGIYKGSNLESYKDQVIFEREYFTSGMNVHIYRDSRDVTGVLLYKFSGKKSWSDFMSFILNHELIKVA